MDPQRYDSVECPHWISSNDFTDPRAAAGHCAREIGSPAPFDGNHPATATGGVGAGVGVATRVFPPSSILPSAMGPAAVSLLPTYTPTGTLITLAAPTFTAAPDVDVGNGWYNAADTELAYVYVSQRCRDEWN